MHESNAFSQFVSKTDHKDQSTATLISSVPLET